MKSSAQNLKVAILCLVLLAGCQKAVLYHELAEEDANSILVALEQENIHANKEQEIRQNEVSWNITLERKDLPRARALLVAKNLPKKRELGLSGVYKEKGLIPTPDEQKARFLLALKGEIINSLEHLPEVVDADVVLNVPMREEFNRAEKQRPTASVVIKAILPPDGRSALSEMKVQEFVANTVEGLAPRDVTVLISYLPSGGRSLRPGETLVLPGAAKVSETEPEAAKPMHELMGIRVEESSKDRLKMYLILFFGLLVVLAGALIVTIVQASRFRREIHDLRSGGAIEGEVAGAGPPRLGPGGEE